MKLPKELDEYVQAVFAESTRPSRTGDCLIWTGCTAMGAVYPAPVVHRSARTFPVRRWWFERQLFRDLRENERVFTTCGTRLCVNPKHLYIQGWIHGKRANYIIKNGKREIIEIKEN